MDSHSRGSVPSTLPTIAVKHKDMKVVPWSGLKVQAGGHTYLTTGPVHIERDA